MHTSRFYNERWLPLQPLLAIADTVRAAYAASETADQIATVAIRVFVKRRAEMWAALSEARAAMDTEAFKQWITEIGIPRDVAGISEPRGRAVPPLLTRGFDD